MKIRILGAGASSGVPSLHRGWGRCDASEPKNRRTRPSILIENEGNRILVDTSPDLREQLLKAEVTKLDAVVFTHGHADHLHGLDDLRGINRLMNQPICAYADANTISDIKQRFGYSLEPLVDGASFYYKPTLSMTEITPGQPIEIAGIAFQPFEQDHGFSKTLGFRFGNAAYTTDLMNLEETSFDVLKGIDTWILGVLTDRPHSTHLWIDRAVEWVSRINPRQAVFTHLGEGLDYQTLLDQLPPGIRPGYDGMILEPH